MKRTAHAAGWAVQRVGSLTNVGYVVSELVNDVRHVGYTKHASPYSVPWAAFFAPPTCRLRITLTSPANLIILKGSNDLPLGLEFS